MNNRLIPIVGMLGAVMLLTGCETAGLLARDDHRPRFHDGARADVILKFNRWDTIHLLRPDSRESGFLPILRRADIQRELQARQLNHDLAVVIFGFRFPGEEEAHYAADWRRLLSTLGFKRVVVLRTGDRPGVDGLPIVMDSGSPGLGSNSSADSSADSSLASRSGLD